MLDIIWNFVVIIFCPILLTTPWVILGLSLTKYRHKKLKYYIIIESLTISIMLIILLLNNQL